MGSQKFFSVVDMHVMIATIYGKGAVGLPQTLFFMIMIYVHRVGLPTSINQIQLRHRKLVCIQLMSSINHVDQGPVHHFILHILHKDCTWFCSEHSVEDDEIGHDDILELSGLKQPRKMNNDCGQSLSLIAFRIFVIFDFIFRK